MLTWDLSVLPVAGISHSFAGGSIEAPRSQSGLTQVIDLAGGGFWQLKLSRVQMFASEQQHRLYLRYRMVLDGGVGKIVIPLINDLVAPPVMTGVPFADGAVHSDGAGHTSSSVVAEFAEDAAVGAGTVTLRVRSGYVPLHDRIFGVLGPLKGWRSYQTGEADDIVALVDGSVLVTAPVRPTLREAISAGTPVDFRRPRCVFRLPAGAAMPWEPEKYWSFMPTITFLEAMG